MEKKTTIAIKVIKNIAWVNVLIYSIMLVVIGTVAKDNIYEVQGDYMSEISTSISSNISQMITEYVTMAQVLSENTLIIEILEETTAINTMQKNDRIWVLHKEIAAIREKFSDSILYISILDLEQDSYFSDDATFSDEDFSFKTRPYYEVVNTGKHIVTEPYKDIATGGMVVSIANPVYNADGVVLGAVLVDVAVDFITNLINTSDFDSTGTNFVLDYNGNIIASRETALSGENYTSLNIKSNTLDSEIKNATNEYINFEMGGIDKIGITTPIGNLGWVTVTSLGMDEYEEHADVVLRILLVMLIFALVCTLIVILTTIKKALVPLEELTHAMHEISNGNLHYALKYESNDEMGYLADDLRNTSKTLAVYIDEISHQLDYFGKGDFTYTTKIEFLGDFKHIQLSIFKFVRLMSTTLHELKGTISQVALGADQVANASQSLAQGTEEQTGELDALSKTVEDITITVDKNAKNADEANNLGSNVNVIMDESKSFMNELLESITQIQTASTDIEKIIKTIDDIAFQTNILALNAAVEAARAGASGKGFAVVADEVRNLAQKSTEAAKGTTSLIKNSLDAVTKGVSIAKGTSDSFTKVDESSKQVIELISKISKASNEQSNSIKSISTGLNQISSVVMQNSVISEENAAVAEELSSQSSIMNDSVNHFRVGK